MGNKMLLNLLSVDVDIKLFYHCVLILLPEK